MEIELRTRSLTAELTFESGNATIKKDVAEVKNGSGFIPNELIEKFISIARDMNQFNKKSDVDFVKMVYDVWLNDSERAEFLEMIAQEKI